MSAASLVISRSNWSCASPWSSVGRRFRRKNRHRHLPDRQPADCHLPARPLAAQGL